jgi:hypothetical protein
MHGIEYVLVSMALVGITLCVFQIGRDHARLFRR